MKYRLSGYRMALAVLLFIMILGMCFLPMLKGSSLGSGNISYVRSIRSIWRSAAFSQTAGSAAGVVIWMAFSIALVAAALVLVLIRDTHRLLYGTVSLIGSLSVVLFLLLILASDSSTFENWGEIAPILTGRSFGIGLYLVFFAGLGAVGLSSRAISGKQAFDSNGKTAPVRYEPEPQTVVFSEGRNEQGGAIVCLSGHTKGSAFRIPYGGQLSVGRDPEESDIVIETADSDISRRHCIVRYDAKRKCYLVRDVSKNGTSISTREEGERLALPKETEVEVQPGAVLHIGKGNYSYRLE